MRVVDLTRPRVRSLLVASLVVLHGVLATFGAGLHSAYFCTHCGFAEGHYTGADRGLTALAMIPDSSAADDCPLCHFFAQSQIPGVASSPLARKPLALDVETASRVFAFVS